jgi:FMN-dependent NADH-azoreductase
MKLLHIDSSIPGANSASSQLSADIVARFKTKHPAISVTYRDLAAALEHAEGYLRGLFGFPDVTDLHVVVAEGLNVGPKQRPDALASATRPIPGFAA